jgi:hypothetical protein
MRRSAAALVLMSLLVAAAPGIRPAHAVPARGPAAAVLTIGVFNDPVSVLNATMWAILELVRIVELGDQIAEHIKEDVRRAQHPQSAPAPVIVPVRPPDAPELLPTRRAAPPSARPAPITDTLPARSIS